MDRLPLLSTLAGAAIGIVATLIADRNRWKREDDKEALRLRLDIYTQYTSAVKVLGETLRALGRPDGPSQGWWPRRYRGHHAFPMLRSDRLGPGRREL
ncbi:hypothetical protein [Streptomyces sp. NPDC008139]|uniref:hypothetical protein n=1 Tax=Streptomyces sp. NPDC008139 TaxID=3364814 RepID=UPI0036E0B19F